MALIPYIGCKKTKQLLKSKAHKMYTLVKYIYKK